jgi:uncharacterized protein (TIGR00288 family)
MDQTRKIGLLIDYDNFNQEKYFPILFEELEGMGDVVLKYAFYSNFKDATLNDKFIKLGIQPMSQLSYSKGKNAVDIRMTIEAVSLLNKSYIDTICLATNDSDFTPLVYHLKENNKYVVGAGDNKAKDTYISAFDNFISVEKISQAKEDLNTLHKESTAILELVATVSSIINRIKDENHLADFSNVVLELKAKSKDFNPKNYGASNNKASTFFQNELKSYFELIKEGKVLYIKNIGKKS